jgi:hypothetical protein
VVPVEKCSHAPSIAVVLLLLLLVSPVLGAVVPGRFGVSAAAAAVNTLREREVGEWVPRGWVERNRNSHFSNLTLASAR